MDFITSQEARVTEGEVLLSVHCCYLSISPKHSALKKYPEKHTASTAQLFQIPLSALPF